MTEYQIFSGICSCCSKKHTGQLPIGVIFKMFGAKTYVLLAILTSKYRLSKMLAKKLLAELFSLPISAGSVSNIEARINQAISASYQEVQYVLKNEPIVHVDETGCRQSNKNGWYMGINYYGINIIFIKSF